jgi:SAM-dependent methyltransferase
MCQVTTSGATHGGGNMRRVLFRGEGSTDWGLAPFTTLEAARTALATVSSLILSVWRHSIDGARLRHYVSRSGHDALRLSIGSGRIVHKGWFGIDLKRGVNVFRCDLRRPFTLSDGILDSLLAEHIIEHFALDDVLRILSECYRVLKPDAPIRIVCPDARIAWKLLSGVSDLDTERQLSLDSSLHGWKRDSLLDLRVANRLIYQFGQHCICLTPEWVLKLLLYTGFRDAYVVPLGQTLYFDAVPDTHLERFPGSDCEAFAIEAKK